MAIAYEDAVAKLHEWTDSPALRNHALDVEAAMRRAEHHYGGAVDEPRWASPACCTTPTTTAGPRSTRGGSSPGSASLHGGPTRTGIRS